MRPFERVYTVTVISDGPRCGIAELDGRPCLWAIWMRWEDAFHAGRTGSDTHPALPEERQRHLEIAAVLPQRLAALWGPVVRATGEFRPMLGKPERPLGRWLEVRWTPVEPSASLPGGAGRPVPGDERL